MLDAEQLVKRLQQRHLTISVAESCTGGRIAARITAVAGSSSVFPGGVVSYCDDVKHRVLGVPQALLDEYGAVSREVAAKMAEGAAKLMGTDMALSATGLAGPDGDGSGKPVGTVFLGLYYRGKTMVTACHLAGKRGDIQSKAVEYALRMALEYLKD